MAVKSKALPVLMLVAVCLLGMRSLTFVGSSATSEEDSAGKPLISATAMVKFLVFFYGLQFCASYLFTEQALKGYWPNGFQTDLDQKIAVYLCKCCGQNMMPTLLLSVIMLVTETVSKVFMLMCALHWGFLVFDITRMTTKCEAIGAAKQSLYPYIAIAAVVSYLSYSTLASTSPATPSVSSSFISASAIVKFMAFFGGLQILTCYVFPEQGLKAYWPDGFKTEKTQKIARYMMMCAGQNMVPMLLLSVIMLKTGTVAKEFVLTNALHWAFCTYDIARMTTTCEAVGIPKKMLYPYVPLAAVISYLSYTAWTTM